jgi:tRNA(His) 5'-end guanylyltransferase
MNRAAVAVLHDLPDIGMAYGVSDEYRQILPSLELCYAMSLLIYSFVFDKHSALFERRER